MFLAYLKFKILNKNEIKMACPPNPLKPFQNKNDNNKETKMAWLPEAFFRNSPSWIVLWSQNYISWTHEMDTVCHI